MHTKILFVRLAISLIFALCLVARADAAPRPYETIDARFDRSMASDGTLRDLVASLRQAVEAKSMIKIAAALTSDFIVVTCGTDPTQACTPPADRPRKPRAPLERLRRGLCCGDVPAKEITGQMRDEAMFGLLGAALAEETIGADPDVKGAACLPAQPAFDRVKAKAMAQAAEIEPDNLRLVATETHLHAKPAANAPDVETMPAGRVVPLVTLGQEGLPGGWNALALPDGRLGFAEKPALDDLAGPRLCFTRDKTGTWSLAYMVLRKDT